MKDSSSRRSSPSVRRAGPLARRRGSLADDVAEHLRREILTGKIRPGDRLDQEGISEQLGVSRSPIREAVVVLGQEGLLTLHRHRGACVAEITQADIAEHYELFGTISGGAAAKAAAALSDDEVRSLAEVHRQFESGSPEEMSAANNEFHRIINSVTSRRTRWLLALLDRAVPADYYEFASDFYSQSVQDHGAILSAIEMRDPQTARRAMEHHLHQGGQAAIAALNDQGLWKDQH